MLGLSLMPHKRLGITRKRVDDMLIASIRFRGRYEEVGRHIGRLLQHCAKVVGGRPFAIYHNSGSAGSYDIEACVPVTQAVETAKIGCRMLEGKDVLSLVHHGPHSTLGETWEALFDYIEKNNMTVDGPGREIYLRGPQECPGDPEKYVTELQVPLRKVHR